jgi:S1-C subfamily serine protease
MSSEYLSHGRSASSPWTVLAPFVVFLLLVASMIWWIGQRPRGLNDPNASSRPVAPPGPLGSEEKARIDLIKSVRDCVVNVDTLLVQRNPFALNVTQMQKGTGSGFIWDEKGHIVTNFHVVEEVARRNDPRLTLRVVLADRSAYNARLVGGTPDFDLAVLRIDAKGKLKPIPVGTSHDLQVGQDVIAIGNPFDLNLTVTRGIISALDRQILSVNDRPISGMIQTDAAINPGNSGGPLIDSSGRLIGVNTAIASPSGSSAGIGFALPVDLVNRVVPELIRTGKMARPALGVALASDATMELIRQQFGIPGGVMIQDVIPNSAAEKAGLRPARLNRLTNQIELGDIILEINGQPVNNRPDLLQILGQYQPGDTVQLKVLRDGRNEITVAVTLQGL